MSIEPGCVNLHFKDEALPVACCSLPVGKPVIGRLVMAEERHYEL